MCNARRNLKFTQSQALPHYKYNTVCFSQYRLITSRRDHRISSYSKIIHLFIFRGNFMRCRFHSLASYHDLHLDVDLQSFFLRRFAKNFVCLFNVCKFEVWGNSLSVGLFQDVRASGSHTMCYHVCDVQLSSFEKIEQHRQRSGPNQCHCDLWLSHSLKFASH